MKAAFILAVLATAASASTFIQFPTSISCADGNGNVATFTTAQLEAAAANSISSKSAYEEDLFGASDEATSHCSGVIKPLYEDPLYSTSIGSASAILFGYDSKLDEFEYCGSIEGTVNADGYSNGCAEQF